MAGQPKFYTEFEVICRERSAFRHGAITAHEGKITDQDDLLARAKQEYPDPPDLVKVTQTPPATHASPRSMADEQLEQRRDDFRAGYRAALNLPSNVSTGEIEHLVREAFPDPPKPREITLSNGWLYRNAENQLQMRHPGVSTVRWDDFGFTIDDIHKLHSIVVAPNE